MTVRIELVWEASCPNVAAAREVVRAALSAAGLPERWSEWQIGVDALPERARGFGSPTILVDGRDVADQAASGADDCCRVYRTASGLRGVPAVEAVLARLS